jgi:hypothetical protein
MRLERAVLFVLSCAVLALGSRPAAGEAGGQTGASSPPPPAKEIGVGESRLRFYGFMRLDAISDDSRPDSFQSPLFILSEDPRATPRNEANFTLHPRLTRLGMDFSGPNVAGLGGAALSGRLEIDFQNGGRESRAIPRYRHAFLKLAWQDASLLAGQTSDVISPLFPSVNNDTLMWNAGNLGDRRAQVRFAYEPARDGIRTSWTVGLGLTGAVDAQDLDGDGVRDGEASALPHVQARFGISVPAAPDRRFEAGISGHLAKEKTSKPVAGATELDSRSLGLDFRLPVAARLLLQGEAWRGKNLSDFRGGIAQDITLSGEEVESQGGWLEVGVPGPRYSVYVGITRDDPRNADIAPQGRTRNGAWYLVQRFKPAKILTFGLDYLDWTTQYRGLADGEDHRINLYLIYEF